MKENVKTDYLKYLFHKTLSDLSRFNINYRDSEYIKKIFGTLSCSENLLVELYVLCNIKEFKNIGKYLVFVLKKIEDNVINFDNLSQNISADAEFVENEILNYLSNPNFIGKITEHEEEVVFKSENTKDEETYDNSDTGTGSDEEIQVNDLPEDSDILKFRKNYLELIQSEESGEEIFYDLPVLEKKEESEPETDLPSFMTDSGNKDEAIKEDNATAHGTEDEVSDIKEEQPLIVDEPAVDEVQPTEIETHDEIIISDKKEEEIETNKKDNDPKIKDEKSSEEERISLSDEIQEELNLFNESEDIQPEEDETYIIEDAILPPTNESFIEYEKEIKEKNSYLKTEFGKMIVFVNQRNSDDEHRMLIITGIIDTSTYLESISRRMSLEIISNIYQTITLSFEKISDGKYDLSEGTINLFKKGLSLVVSLIMGEDYFGYKDILKSIENIRNSLIEEKEKREKYLKRLREKLDLEENIDKQYPEDYQKEKLSIIKQIIKNTEVQFNMLDKITGEYQIYEALRSLSGNLNNFKEIVRLSKELQMRKLIQLAEASYIFTKFLQNYRINPVTIETKEIFGYIIYNLKSLALGKYTEDVDIFISYLNDPVKIFTKSEKKKN